MAISDTLRLGAAFIAGVALGGFFFGGLWWTVKIGVSSRQPALWFFGSVTLRMSLTLVGFYFVSDGNVKRLVLCLLGFVIARHVVSRTTRIPGAPQVGAAREASHAP